MNIPEFYDQNGEGIEDKIFCTEALPYLWTFLCEPNTQIEKDKLTSLLVRFASEREGGNWDSFSVLGREKAFLSEVFKKTVDQLTVNPELPFLYPFDYVGKTVTFKRPSTGRAGNDKIIDFITEKLGSQVLMPLNRLRTLVNGEKTYIEEGESFVRIHSDKELE